MGRKLFFWIKAILAAFIVAALVRTFAFTSCTIPFSGMENSLYRGDRIIVNKWSYGLRTPLVKWFGYHRWGKGNVRKGDIAVFNNPCPENPQTPVDRREVFISRCMGLPGDTLMLAFPQLDMTPGLILSPDYKSLYAYHKGKEDLLLQTMRQLGIHGNELVGFADSTFIRSFSHYEIYLLRQKLGQTVRFHPLQSTDKENIHPFVIPRKGMKVDVYPWNIRLMQDAIARHEGRKAEIKGDTLFIDSRPASSYSFSNDYYWMVSNNSLNRNDSRQFGFVPESHLIGRAAFVWFSKDPDAGWPGGCRWDRFLQSVK